MELGAYSWLFSMRESQNKQINKEFNSEIKKGVIEIYDSYRYIQYGYAIKKDGLGCETILD